MPTDDTEDMSEFDELLKRSKEQEAQQQTRAEYELLKAAKMKALAPAVIQQLVRELQAKAKEFNDAFQDDEQRIATVEAYDNGFRAHRTHLPEVEAQLLADYTTGLISLTVMSRSVSWSVPAKEIDVRYQFELQSSGQIYISDGNQAVSNTQMIDLLFKPFFRFK